MRIFVTGATGFIGQVVVQELFSAGHQVLGLARSDKSAESLAALGVEVHRGSLEDLDSLKRGASRSDGVIHLAFIHDFSDYDGSCHTDRLAIETMGAALAGSNRPLVIPSGSLVLPPGRLGTEDDTPVTTGPAANRVPSELLALSLVSQGVRAMVVRLPPTTHGDGDHGFIPILIATARGKGEFMYIDDGVARWPATHRLDAATVFRLALEKGRAGSTFHAVAEEGVSIKDIAEIIGKQLDVPVVNKTPEEAQQSLGLLALALGYDNPLSSAKTREQLGWRPEHPWLLSDLKEGTYFKTE